MRFPLLLAAVAWTISLIPPADVKADIDTPLQAVVRDETGAPVKDAKVDMTVTMVAMDHGEFKHEAKEAKPGAYKATAKFLMAGTWNVKVKAQKGSETAVKDFKIEVKE